VEVHAELWMSPGYIMFQLVLSSGNIRKAMFKVTSFWTSTMVESGTGYASRKQIILP
jgi:hypothetical protein